VEGKLKFEHYVLSEFLDPVFYSITYPPSLSPIRVDNDEHAEFVMKRNPDYSELSEREINRFLWIYYTAKKKSP